VVKIQVEADIFTRVHSCLNPVLNGWQCSCTHAPNEGAQTQGKDTGDCCSEAKVHVFGSQLKSVGPMYKMQHIGRHLNKFLRLFHLYFTAIHCKLNGNVDTGCTVNTKMIVIFVYLTHSNYLIRQQRTVILVKITCY